MYDLAVKDQDVIENIDTWDVHWYYKAHVDTSWTHIDGFPDPRRSDEYLDAELEYQLASTRTSMM